MNAMAFSERGGRVRAEHAFAKDPSVTAAVREHIANLADISTRAQKQAPPIPTVMVAAWEFIVMDSGKPKYERM